ncbi:MAG: response regulator transcription factor [Ilumatobacteraceae bacterium]|jgi:DNA-binding NarL/FixJ family response regulator
MTALRVVVADDNVFIRNGIAAMIDAIDDMELVAECSDLPELRSAVADHEPDLVVTDIQMPPTLTDEGIVAAIEIRAERKEVGVLVLSQYVEPEYVMTLFEDGSEGLGYLLKERVADLDEFERAVRSVASGQSAVDPKVVEVLVSSRSQRPSEIDRLTPRETEVLGLIAEGLNNAAIADRLVLGDKAVAKHINGIFSKLGLSEEDEVHRRVKAVLLWLAM